MASEAFHSVLRGLQSLSSVDGNTHDANNSHVVVDDSNDSAGIVHQFTAAVVESAVTALINHSGVGLNNGSDIFGHGVDELEATTGNPNTAPSPSPSKSACDSGNCPIVVTLCCLYVCCIVHCGYEYVKQCCTSAYVRRKIIHEWSCICTFRLGSFSTKVQSNWCQTYNWHSPPRL